MEYYKAEREKKLLPFRTAWMELQSVMLSEISQVVKVHKIFKNNSTPTENIWFHFFMPSLWFCVSLCLHYGFISIHINHRCRYSTALTVNVISKLTLQQSTDTIMQGTEYLFWGQLGEPHIRLF